MLKRTHGCCELRSDHVGEEVILCGWVNTLRDQGRGLVFVDLRDRDGVTQLVFDLEDIGEALVESAGKLRNEDVIAVRGTVRTRESGNPKLPTGEIELLVTELDVLSHAETPPFVPEEKGTDKEVREDVRLRYRYIDLRRPKMQRILRMRHDVTMTMRRYLSDVGFLEIETPFLCKSTPEGARDFLVPSRVQPGCFYALPQSPQLFKQILMVAGVDKYFQIVRCFRDEDPRADRQAEFTQLDIEMSFVDSDDVLSLIEALTKSIWKETIDVDLPDFPRLTYREAVDRFGIDRPDMRFGLELVDVSDLAREMEFGVFHDALAKPAGVVKAIRVPGGASMSRKKTDALAEFAKGFGAGGLPTVKRTDDGFATGIAKFVTPIGDKLIERTGAEVGDLIIFAADTYNIASKVLGELRIKLAGDLDLIAGGQWKPLWIVDFPAFDWNDDEKRWDPLHHPFTAPKPEDVDRLETDPGDVLTNAYDLVLNGSELAGGSIRIHDTAVQQRVFRLLGLTDEQAREKFSFLLDALQYGAPPHGGIAFGLDRVIMLLAGTTNIRDVIAFPKTLNGADLMTQAPSVVDEAQLQELHIALTSDPSNV
ncbi:MAG: aspartate--tRNA ligase [Phycisphaerales bacterium]|nr:aspartate--tRNA ligase [Phycisphaerales bacterium]